MTLKIGGTLTLLTLSFAFGPAEAQEQGPRALLRVQADSSRAGHGLTLQNHGLFLALDRTFQAVTVTNRTHVGYENYWQTRRTTGAAERGSFAALRRALAEFRIGARSDHCTVVASTFPTFGTYDIVWYGIGARRSRLLIELNGEAPLCPPDVAILLDAINAFAHANGVPEFGVSVP